MQFDHYTKVWVKSEVGVNSDHNKKEFRHIRCIEERLSLFLTAQIYFQNSNFSSYQNLFYNFLSYTVWYTF